MDRRRFTKNLGCGALSLTLTESVHPKTHLNKTNKEMLLFIGTYTTDTNSKGIYVYKFNSKDGALRYLTTVENVVDPSFLTVDESGRYLYAVNETLQYEGEPSGAVSSFAIDRESGALTFLNRQPSLGGAPCYITVTRDGCNALVANYIGANVAAFPIDAHGKLGRATDVVKHSGTGPNKARQESAHAHSIDLDRANTFAASCDLGADKIFIYRFDPKAGRLTLNPAQPYYQARAGSGPRHLVFHSSRDLAFLISELSSTVTAFRYDVNAGALQEIQTLSTLPAGWAGENTGAEIQISPDGQFLYASNRGDNSIVCFGLDNNSGVLTHISRTATGGRDPRDFIIDPTGKFLLAANQRSDNIVVFSIDPGSGKLQPTGKIIHVPAPVCLKLL
jgi:6-phosphogluconolactonase